MINIDEIGRICDKFNCKYTTGSLLKDYTTFRIGGKCTLLIDVTSSEAAVELIGYIRINDVKYAIIGRGSNILAADKGFDGVLLHLGSGFSAVEINGTTIRTEAGASLADVCKKAQRAGLSGMENLYGIPGSVGGGLYMNAGAYGSEMKDVVVSAEYIDENGRICEISAEDMDLSYRHSIFSERNCIITSVTFELTEGNPDSIKEAMAECMQKRISKQPLEFPSAGSTFKRPVGSYASLLIEQCGLKGMSVGGAQVSEKHSGFVINKGGATCSDVLELCRKVREIVQEKTGYSLELEPIIFE
ncbi:MAG: UDP-N-acetylmuramate dehydrogenase [Ruminococcus sp.]|nr:UDP-N-acetylmuramate dehydrogenase [Ruminococcus sp.]